MKVNPPGADLGDVGGEAEDAVGDLVDVGLHGEMVRLGGHPAHQGSTPKEAVRSPRWARRSGTCEGPAVVHAQPVEQARQVALDRLG